MGNEHLGSLINALLENESFPLIPHHPNPEKDLKFIFDFFINLDRDIIVRELMKFFEHTNLEKGLLIIVHYKGKPTYYNKNLDFTTYTRIKPFIDDLSINRFNEQFYEIYATEIIKNNITTIDESIIKYIKNNDLQLYMDVSLKLKSSIVNELYEIDASKVFYWINNHTDKYVQLKELNQAQYIFDNMNGKLDINNETLKYFFEICPIDLKVYKELKNTLSLETIWKFSNHKLTIDFYIELVESIEDVKFIVSIKDISFETINKMFEKIEKSYPSLYSHLNSLLLLKNDFCQ